VVVATKVHGVMRDEPNGRGLSRKAIFHELDESLRRLGMDYVDLYQIHRWDYETPIEETMEALHEVVKSGKVRYIGASSMYAWQFAKALFLADRHHWTRFVSMQNHYNLLYREEEREMMAFCRSEGIGVIPWSPLARGRLTRPWKSEKHQALRDRPVRQRHVLTKPKRAIARSSTGWDRSPRSAAFPAPRSRLRGCSENRSSPRRLLGPPNRTISRTRSPRFPCASRQRRSPHSRSSTSRIRSSASAEGWKGIVPIDLRRLASGDCQTSRSCFFRRDDVAGLIQLDRVWL